MTAHIKSYWIRQRILHNLKKLAHQRNVSVGLDVLDVDQKSTHMPAQPSPSNIWQEILFSRHTRVFSPYVELYIKGRPSLILRGIDCQLNNKAPQNPNDVIEVGSPCPKHYNEQKRHNLLKKNSAVGSKFPEMIKFWSAPDYYSCNLCICEAYWPEAKGFQMHLH